MPSRGPRQNVARLIATTAVGAALAVAASFGAPATGTESPVDGRITSTCPAGSAALQKLAEQGAKIGGGALSKSHLHQHGRSRAADVKLSCDDATSPENETPIVVDPANPNHLLAGSNDYHMVSPATPCRGGSDGLLRVFRRRHDLDRRADPDGLRLRASATGIPSPAFDRKFGTAHMAQLNTSCGNTGPNCGSISISVATSRDGGRTWGNPVNAANGSGSLTPSPQGSVQRQGVADCRQQHRRLRTTAGST